MKQATSTLLLGFMGIWGMIGCAQTPPPPRVPVPTVDRDAPITYRNDAYKPLPSQQPMAQEQPPFIDVPLISQQPPEQPAFVSAYRQVGSPRIVVFVNRTLEGNIVPDRNDPVVRVDRTSRGRNGTESRSTDVYLRPGQYDDATANRFDYAAVENSLTDWLSCNGQVTIISPTMARQRLSDQQVRELQEGRPQAMSEMVQQLGADIFVQLQAHPTRQTARGLEVRMIVEAMNVKGGESIARAVVDVPPPLEKTTINDYTRFLARKLMDGMLSSWSAPPPAAPATRPE